MFKAVIAGYSRSPFTMARKGELIDVKPVNLLAEVINNLVTKSRIKREDIDESLLEREKAIFSDQAKDSGKPENILDKIVEGRVEKFFAESCLLEQQFIKDPERKVVDLLTEAVATLGENIIINRFTRFAIGESSDNGQSH